MQETGFVTQQNSVVWDQMLVCSHTYFLMKTWVTGFKLFISKHTLGKSYLFFLSQEVVNLTELPPRESFFFFCGSMLLFGAHSQEKLGDTGRTSTDGL